MMQSDRLEEAHNELLVYTLEHASHDPSFIHQIAVDTWAAQHANKNSKQIGIAFALIGLYLHIEKGFSGKQVQEAHMYLAKKRKNWPEFNPPNKRGDITVIDVMSTSPGKNRDEMIKKWSISVWGAWKESHKKIENLIQKEMGI